MNYNRKNKKAFSKATSLTLRFTRTDCTIQAYRVDDAGFEGSQDLGKADASAPRADEWILREPGEQAHMASVLRSIPLRSELGFQVTEENIGNSQVMQTLWVSALPEVKEDPKASKKGDSTRGRKVEPYNFILSTRIENRASKASKKASASEASEA